MVQGIFDDLNPETRKWAYPDTGSWDAERNTREFLAAMPEWRRHGLLGLHHQPPGRQPAGLLQDAALAQLRLHADGSLRPDYMRRLERILDRADELGMVAILGLFYFGQDERLEGRGRPSSVRCVEATLWLLDEGVSQRADRGQQRVQRAYDHAVLQAATASSRADRARSVTRNGGASRQHQLRRRDGPVARSRRAGSTSCCSTATASTDRPNRANGGADTRQVAGYRPMPILFNEDDHFDFDKPANNFAAAVGAAPRGATSITA